MATTNTNKQPMFVDRPLIERTRLTNQVVGGAGNLNVFGGQNPALLVDMDATLTSDNNSGGIIDSITIVRDNFGLNQTTDYVLDANTATGEVVSFTSGQTIYIKNNSLANPSGERGVGYYTYTGSVSIEGPIGGIEYSGITTPSTSGFAYSSVATSSLPAVTFVCYHTRQTTVPIPANGDYGILFSKTIPVNETFVDCSDVMPEMIVPVPEDGNTTGLGEASPLKNRAIHLQRGDRLYIGVLQNGVFNTPSGYIPGAHAIAQGGYF
tara:strand:- start:25400 stop:26197 length:798 start_codon:yes stop_codon:yes gene_type:complete